jgi:hypothetical protein
MSRARGIVGTTPKYHNIPMVEDGLRFDSKREWARYRELKLLQAAGIIGGLEADKRRLHYPLIVNGERIGVYTPDFRYMEGEMVVIEDVKVQATKTQAYQLRKRLLHALYGLTIREV